MIEICRFCFLPFSTCHNYFFNIQLSFNSLMTYFIVVRRICRIYTIIIIAISQVHLWTNISFFYYTPYFRYLFSPFHLWTCFLQFISSCSGLALLKLCVPLSLTLLCSAPHFFVVPLICRVFLLSYLISLPSRYF